MRGKIKIKKTAKYMIFIGSLQRVRFFFGAVFFLMLMLFSGQASAKIIDIDGDFNDWTGVPKIISDSLKPYPYEGTTYYYNLASESWQANDPGYATCMFNENHALEVADVSMTNDNNNIYFELRRGGSFSRYFWLDGGQMRWENYLNEPAPSENSNPCASHIVVAPADFHHDMVFSFDKDRDGRFDYYLVFKIFYKKGGYVEKDTGLTNKNFIQLDVHILQAAGNVIYTGEENENFLAGLGNGEYKISRTVVADSGGLLQELRVDLGKILSFTGMEKDQLYDIHYLSHSERSNVTSTGSYVFEKNDPVKLKAKLTRQIKKSNFWVRGKTAGKTNLLLLVDGEEYRSFKSGASGRFSEKVGVGFGSHDIKLMACHNSKGTNNISGKVVRKIVRAIDMPLDLDVIHSKNETQNTILEIWGKAYGVSEVRVFVNDIEWGRAVVKSKDGYYKFKVRLSEGENILKVTAAKDDETLSVTKIVKKI